MDAENVVEKILSDARSEAEKIERQAQDAHAAENSGLERRLREYKMQTQALAEQAAKDEKSHLLAAARMEIAQDRLREKGKLLNEVFDQVRGRLRSLPDGEYRALMVKLMLEAVESGDEEVLVDKDDKRIDHGLIDQVNGLLSRAGKGNVRLSDERLAVGAGFILRRGRIRNNVSLDALLDQARKDLEIQLAGELFS